MPDTQIYENDMVSVESHIKLILIEGTYTAEDFFLGQADF